MMPRAAGPTARCANLIMRSRPEMLDCRPVGAGQAQGRAGAGECRLTAQDHRAVARRGLPGAGRCRLDGACTQGARCRCRWPGAADAGAGGNTGWVNGLAFVRAPCGCTMARSAGGWHLRRCRAAGRASPGLRLRADGHRFIATTESLAGAEYQTMLVSSRIDDIALTAASAAWRPISCDRRCWPTTWILRNWLTAERRAGARALGAYSANLRDRAAGSTYGAQVIPSQLCGKRIVSELSGQRGWEYRQARSRLQQVTAADTVMIWTKWAAEMRRQAR